MIAWQENPWHGLFLHGRQRLTNDDVTNFASLKYVSRDQHRFGTSVLRKPGNLTHDINSRPSQIRKPINISARFSNCLPI